MIRSAAQKADGAITQKNNVRLSVFIPIFNEEKIMKRRIMRIARAVGNISADHEIFIVNDASTDSTPEIARTIEQADERIRLLNYDKGPSRRENLALSFRKATGDIIVSMDIDLMGTLFALPDLINEIISGADIAIGSRYLPSSKSQRKPFRQMISVLYNSLVRWMFGTKIRDHTCGFKAYKKDVILHLVDELGYDASFTRGIFWDAEMLIRAGKEGFAIREIPIRWRERKQSALSFQREIRTIGYILSRWRKL